MIFWPFSWFKIGLHYCTVFCSEHKRIEIKMWLCGSADLQITVVQFTEMWVRLNCRKRWFSITGRFPQSLSVVAVQHILCSSKILVCMICSILKIKRISSTSFYLLTHPQKLRPPQKGKLPQRETPPKKSIGQKKSIVQT